VSGRGESCSLRLHSPIYALNAKRQTPNAERRTPNAER
jgi:hypothetical protein